MTGTYDMSIYRIAAPVIATAAAGMGIIAQVPSSEMGSEYTKFGVIGVLAMVILFLLQYTIPKIMDAHKESFNRLADEVKEGSERTTAEIKAGNDKVATLLQSTLVQVIKERHEERK